MAWEEKVALFEMELENQKRQIGSDYQELEKKIESFDLLSMLTLPDLLDKRACVLSHRLKGSSYSNKKAKILSGFKTEKIFLLYEIFDLIAVTLKTLLVFFIPFCSYFFVHTFLNSTKDSTLFLFIIQYLGILCLSFLGFYYCLMFFGAIIDYFTGVDEMVKPQFRLKRFHPKYLLEWILARAIIPKQITIISHYQIKLLEFRQLFSVLESYRFNPVLIIVLSDKNFVSLYLFVNPSISILLH